MQEDQGSSLATNQVSESYSTLQALMVKTQSKTTPNRFPVSRLLLATSCMWAGGEVIPLASWLASLQLHHSNCELSFNYYDSCILTPDKWVWLSSSTKLINERVTAVQDGDR